MKKTLSDKNLNVKEKFQHPEISICKDNIFNMTNIHFRKTKIICTLGPQSSTVEVIGKLLDAGMNIARLNFSHGDHKYHRNIIKNLREALKKRPKIHCGIMLDTRGPEIRTGYFEDNIKEINILKGQELELTIDYSFKGNEKKISISYPKVLDVEIGQEILFCDGNLTGVVVKKTESSLIVKLNNDFILGECKNIFLPKVKIDLPTLSESDEEDLIEFGLKEGIDFVAASFIRKSEDIEYIRDVLGPKGSHIKIISKIENYEGLENYEEILQSSDGIMVARGDLGMELPIQKVFIAQKYLIERANKAGKPVITARQMLESMMKNGRPSRPEASDVANAVLDGSDALMLSGETANGLFPVEACEVMSKICVEAESCINYNNLFYLITHSIPKPLSIEESMCISAVQGANDSGAEMIVVITESGDIARLIAKYRPKQNIIALCMSSAVQRQLSLSRGIIPFKIPAFIDSNNLISNAISYAVEDGYLKKGDKIVCLTGMNENMPENANILKIMTVN